MLFRDCVYAQGPMAFLWTESERAVHERTGSRQRVCLVVVVVAIVVVQVCQAHLQAAVLNNPFVVRVEVVAGIFVSSFAKPF